MLKDIFLERHGDAESLNGNLAHAGEQIFYIAGLQRNVDSVNVLAAKRGVHHLRRKRMNDGIAGDTINFRRSIDHIDTIDIAQNPRRNLSWRGFLSGLRRGEGKCAAKADVEDS